MALYLGWKLILFVAKWWGISYPTIFIYLYIVGLLKPQIRASFVMLVAQSLEIASVSANVFINITFQRYSDKKNKNQVFTFRIQTFSLHSIMIESTELLYDYVDALRSIEWSDDQILEDL